MIFVVFFFLRWFFLLLFRFTLNQTLLFTLITLLKEFIWRYWCIMFDWWWKRCCLSTYNVALNRLCRKITMLYLHLSCYFFVLKMKRNRVFKLLNQVLIYGLPALQNGSSIFETLNLFQNKTCCINFVFNCSINWNYALFCILLGFSIW